MKQGMGFKRLSGTIFGNLMAVLLIVLAIGGTGGEAFAFTADRIGDFGNITVLSVDGNYDAMMPGGRYNSGPREDIAKAFYETHSDDYDFIVIFSDFDFRMPYGEAVAFYSSVQNDVEGIGLDTFDYSFFYGSDGRLQGTIDMGNLANLASDPMDPRFSFTMGTLSHELMHRWAAFIDFRNSDGDRSAALLGKDDAHWSFLLDTQGSLMYGNPWRDNGDGTFTSTPGRKYFSPLDLYLMGMIDKSELAPMLLIDSPETDPRQVSKSGVTISGSAQTVTIEDIIDAEGERVPSAENSQKEFTIGCVFITQLDTVNDQNLYLIRNILKNWMVWHSSLTFGASTIEFKGIEVDLPVNPGPTPPYQDSRVVPPSVQEGIDWLLAAQEEDGSWADTEHTVERDTPVAISALVNVTDAENAISDGADWLETQASANTDYLASKIDALSRVQRSVGSFLDDLMALQNSDGGWGTDGGYTSNAFDTAIALKAMAAAGHDDDSAVDAGIAYLKSAQAADGGWGSHPNFSDILTTTTALNALNAYRLSHPAQELNAVTQDGLNWLYAKQNGNGGFGNSDSTVYDTAVVLLTFKAFEADTDYVIPAIGYLFDMQAFNGSWHNTVFDTASAVSALVAWEDLLSPDLTVTGTDITFTPSTITQTTEDITISVTVNNRGMEPANNVTLNLYDGQVDSAHLIGQQVLSIDVRSTVVADITVTFSDLVDHQIHAVIDADNLVQESNEGNNAAYAVLINDLNPDPDLQVLFDDVICSPETVRHIPEPVTISALIRNPGLTGVVQVPVHLYADSIDAGSLVAERLVDVGAQSTTFVDFATTVDDGAFHRYFIIADPAGVVAERVESNNMAIKLLPSDPTYDFTFSQPGIATAWSPVQIGQPVTVTTRIHNSGTRDAFNVPLRFFLNDNGSHYDIVTETVDLPAGTTLAHELTWTPVHAGDGLQLSVQADPHEAFDELSESNNTAMVDVTVNAHPEPNLTLTHQDISVTPSPAHEAGSAVINALITNVGGSTATNVAVEYAWHPPGQTPLPLGQQVLPSLAPGQSAVASLTVNNIAVVGEHLVAVTVDPGNAVQEFDEDDNYAFTSLDILTLPDFIVESASIRFAPAAPADGDMVDVLVTVQNGGEQSAANVPVAIFDNNVLVASGTIDSIAGNSQNTIGLAFDTTGKSGTRTIRIEVDRGNTILEKETANNVVTRILGVQNGDLWLSQRYVSADGGVVNLESTFFFRLDEPTTFTVVVVDSRGRVRKTFDGTEFENSTGASVTWDGRNDRGMIVGDGEYQIQVRDTQGRVLRSLPVSIDNNLSSLAEAIDTDYLTRANVSCMLPYISAFEWFRDESGMVFHITSADEDAPEFPTGLYSMAPDGDDVTRLVPWEWSTTTNPDYRYTYSTSYGGGKGFALSPDDQTIAFILKKNPILYSGGIGPLTQNQLWVVDRFGENRSMVDTFDYELEGGGDAPLQVLRGVYWSGNSDWLAYQVRVGIYPDYQDKIYTARPDGTDKTEVLLPEGELVLSMQWSPSGQRLMYKTYNDDTRRYAAYIAEPLQQPRVLLELTDETFSSLDWANHRKVVAVVDDRLVGQDSIRILDAVDPALNAEPIWLEIDDSVAELEINPMGDGFAFVYRRYVESNDGGYGGYGGELRAVALEGYGGYGGADLWPEANGYWSVQNCDMQGQCEVLHESRAFPNYSSIKDLSWSSDGEQLAFVDYVYEHLVNCEYNAYFVILDLPKGTSNAFPARRYIYPPCEYEEPSSFHVWSRHQGLWLEQGVLHFGAVLETRELALPRVTVDESGSVTLQVVQNGTDEAHLDHAVLIVQGQAHAPDEAVNTSDGGASIITRVAAQDVQLADVTAATLQLTWHNLPVGETVSLRMHASESNNGTDLVDDPLADEDGESGDEDDGPFTGSIPRYYGGTLQWLYDGAWLMAQDSDGYFAFHADRGERIRFPYDRSSIRLSPRSRYITFNETVPGESVCFGRGSQDLWVVRSLLNLTVDLKILREDITSALTLKGTASDLNFESYSLSYADVTTPDQRFPIKPPNDSMVLDDELGIWIPPYPGTFFVYMGAEDKAGHSTGERKRVSWGLLTKIADLYLEEELISPNGDGIKDTLGLTYTILQPVHLEFYVYDQDNRRVATLYRDYAEPPAPDGKDTVYWNGRDDNGLTMPDGQYRIQVFDYSFNFEIDTTAPEINIAMSSIKSYPTGDKKTSGDGSDVIYYARLQSAAMDKNLSQWTLEYGVGDNPQAWYEYSSSGSQSDSHGMHHTFSNSGDYGTNPASLDFAVGKKFRLTAHDRAGNSSAMASEVLEELLIFNQWKSPLSEEQDPWYDFFMRLNDDGSFNIKDSNKLPVTYLFSEDHALSLISTYRQPADRVVVQLRREDMAWHDTFEVADEIQVVDQLTWSGQFENFEGINSIRLKALFPSGAIAFSNPVKTMNEVDLEMDCKTGVTIATATVLPHEELTHVAVLIDWGDGNITVDREWDAFKGDTIPYGEFKLWEAPDWPKPERLQSGKRVILEAVGLSGDVYTAERLLKCSLDIEFEDDCGHYKFTGRIAAELLPEIERLSIYLYTAERGYQSRVWDTAKGDEIPAGFSYREEFHGLPQMRAGDYAYAEAVLKNGNFRAAKSSVPRYFEPLINCGCGSTKFGFKKLIIKNTLAEPLTQMRFLHVALSGDITVLAEWAPGLGSGIPEGYYLDQPLDLDSLEIGDVLRLEGTDYNSAMHIGEYTVEGDDLDPEACKSSVGGDFSFDYHSSSYELETSYIPAVECDDLSPGPVSVLMERQTQTTVPLVDLAYYVYNPRTTNWHLLQRYDLTVEEWGPAELDPFEVNEFGFYTYEEGLYPVNANVTNEKSVVKSAASQIVVDRTIPQASIHAPNGSQRVCPVTEMVGDSKRRVVDIDGLADDELKFGFYQVLYALGDDPDQWYKAKNLSGQDIKGESAKDGLLGRWDVTALPTETVSLKLESRDWAGNIKCDIKYLQIDLEYPLTAAADRKLFSPNGDGFLDTVTINYAINETVDIAVEVLDDTGALVKTIADGFFHDQGSAEVVWDGTNNSGQYAADGLYTIRVRATDLCADVMEVLIEEVEVDRTPPQTLIGFPQADSPVGVIVEVMGTVQDPNFKNYWLDLMDESHPEPLKRLGEGDLEIEADMLGRWNTWGMEGVRLLQLTAVDTVGNVGSVNVLVDLNERKTLIVNLDGQPRLFSPNGDGRLETATLVYELNTDLNELFDVVLELRNESGTAVRTYTYDDAAAGISQIVWDGLDDNGVLAADDTYEVILTAVLASNPNIAQTETITLVLDATAPAVALTGPLDQAYIPGPLTIEGSISDDHLVSYSMNLASLSGPLEVATGKTNRTAYTFAVLDDLDDGPYTLTVNADDQGLIETQAAIELIVDKTPPKAELLVPQPGGLFGGLQPVLEIRGTLEEENPEIWQLRYRRVGDTDWITLEDGVDLPTAELIHPWAIGPDDGIADGDYELSLFIRDRAGWEAEVQAALTIDNTPPQVALTQPLEGDYVKQPTAIMGTAADDHLENFQVQAAEGTCASATRWNPLNESDMGINDGTLAHWSVLPPDADYCLRVIAVDKVGLDAQTRVHVIVDTQPPAAPVLSGEIVNRNDGVLTWTANTEPDLAGYDLYRDGKKLNTDLITTNDYTDPGLAEGIYTYMVRAVDHAGWQSEPSNTVTLEVDLTPPVTRIRVPGDGATVSDLVDIKGTAYSEDDFKEYRLYVGAGTDPDNWQLLNTSPVPTSYGLLGQWETVGQTNGAQFTFKLEAEDLSGNVGQHQITVVVDNLPPAPPVLLSAQTQGPLSNTIDLVWEANTEPDLAGYLLYRNGELANVSGNVVGDLAPYLLGVTAYADLDMADGSYEYYLLAMDTAGNISEPSNRMTVPVDTRAPRAVIVDPPDGYRFDKSFMVRAVSEDLDIATVQFQYRAAGATTWNDLGAALDGLPYITYLNPEDLALPYGFFELRALATDLGGRADTAPPAITVEHVDITPPLPPIELSTSVNGGTVTLTWTANTETDLAGYHVYEVLPGELVRLNTDVIPAATFIPPGEEDGLPDKIYHFQVFAVDTTGNQSQGSNVAPATVYTPLVEQPFTPTAEPLQHLFGQTLPSDNVEIFNDTGSGPQVAGTLAADDQGNIEYDLTLTEGINRITLRATDDQGNISKTSAEVVVVHGLPPQAPTGLAGDVADHDVDLTWNPNAETDLAGYRLYRNGAKLNQDSLFSGGTASASIYDYRAGNARDGNIYSYWYCSVYPENDSGHWWQLDFGTPIHVGRIEIDWYRYNQPPVKYELQAWSGFAWIPLIKVMGNEDRSNQFDLAQSYVTNRIRLVIPPDGTSADTNWVYLTEFKVRQRNPVAVESYLDEDVTDGEHVYHLEAVNDLGMVSPPSDELDVAVGDTIAPETPINLTAEADGSDIDLTWTPSGATDLAGYHIYRLAGQEWQRINGGIVSGTAYTDTDLSNGTYTYRVTAADSVGNESDPSNEDSATVNIALPSEPINVTAVPLPQGGTIRVCWEAVDGASGYHLYRSTISGGPYDLVIDEVLTETCYLDTGLTDGTTYYYTVQALDDLGNESTDSLEANAVPADLIAPPAPVLFLPTIAGVPVTVTASTTDIDGWAEADSLVTLLHDDIAVGTTRATSFDSLRVYDFLRTRDDEDQVNKWVISPDGRRVVYTIYDETIWDYVGYIYNRSDGSWVSIGQDVSAFAWSPDSNRLAYIARTPSSGDRLTIYDVSAQRQTRATGTDNYYQERMPSWTADGSRVIFISSQFPGSDQICAYEPASGAVTPLMDAGSARYPELSPDDRYISYMAYSYPEYRLYVADLQTGDDPIEMGTGIVRDDQGRPHMAWSPDGTSLTYISNSNSPGGDIYTVNPLDQTTETLTTQGRVSCFTWLPGGRHLAYAHDGEPFELWILDLDEDTTRQIEEVPLNWTSDRINVSEKGQLAYRHEDAIILVSPAGHFEFFDVTLHPDTNQFSATAADAAGNLSPQSEPIEVIVDGAQLPDLEVTEGDLFHYPYVPVEGEQVLYTAIVRNSGLAPASDVVVECYVWDASDRTELAHTELIPSLAAGEEKLVQFEWDSTGLAGQATLIVELDAEDRVFEAHEYNNLAFKDLYIAATGGLAMETMTEYDLYSANEDVNISVDIYNSGGENDVTLLVTIVDSQQAPVAMVGDQQFALSYTPKSSRSFVWNTGRTLAGEYFVHSVLYDQSGQLAVNLVPFTIEGNMELDAALNTDRLHYMPNQTVQIHGSLSNLAPNLVLTDLDARIVVQNSELEIQAEHVDHLDYLLGGASAAVNTTWNTATHAPGEYTATLIITQDTLELARIQRVFHIDEVDRLRGGLTVQPAVVSAGTDVEVAYTVTNLGNTALTGLPLTVALIDPEDTVDLIQESASADIAINEAFNGSVVFGTDGLSAGTYPVELRGLTDEGLVVLARGALTIQADVQFPVEITGTLTADPETVPVGEWVALRYTVTNDGNVDLNRVDLSISLPQEVSGTLERTIALPIGATFSGQFLISTSTLLIDTYTGALLVRIPGNLAEAELDQASFTVVEPEPNFHIPVAIAGGPYLAAVGEPVEVDGSASFDLDEGQSESGQPPFDTIIDYRWETDPMEPHDFDDASGATAQLPAYDTPGTHSAILQVTDNTEAAFPSEGQPNQSSTAMAEVLVHGQSMLDFAARAKRTICQLTWTHIGAAEYEVLRSEKGPNENFVPIGSTTSTYSLYTDDIQTNKDYWYRVRCTLDGEQWMSASVHVYSVGRRR